MLNKVVEYSSEMLMVNHLVERSSQLDLAYGALADPTRRSVLVALSRGEARITDVADPLPISFAAVSRHVAVLEAAGLIQREVRGREHWLSVRTEGLRDADAWLHEQSALWAKRADALAARLERQRPKQ
jgi:DNA-binding transcriptional ArsR family regulator